MSTIHHPTFTPTSGCTPRAAVVLAGLLAVLMTTVFASPRPAPAPPRRRATGHQVSHVPRPDVPGGLLRSAARYDDRACQVRVPGAR